MLARLVGILALNISSSLYILMAIFKFVEALLT
jgi:hypothetical protein